MASGTIDATSIDNLFLLVMALLVFLMQVGFAFLEAGAVRMKNTTNILIKNLLDSLIGIMAYWLFGYAFAFGDKSNVFIGYWNFALSYMDTNNYALFFFQFVFAATATTIVSGAVAERCEFMAYAVYSIIISGFIYPVVTHWAWADSGWLKQGITMDAVRSNGSTYSLSATYQDFAGSGVVHIVGGVAAFVGAAFLGPRIGRFDKETKKVNTIPGHSVPLAFMGGFILIFGFFAFNGGSQLSITKAGDGGIVALIMINTMISAALAAFVCLLAEKFIFKKKWSLLTTINGSLAGMVAICAGCNIVYPWGSAVIGLFAGISYLLWSKFMLLLMIDDPLDAVAVHFGGGIWGVIAVAFLNMESGILFKWDQQSGLNLGWQLVGLLAIIGWTAALSLLMFGILKAARILRVSEELELKGLDIPKHGEPAYPLQAVGHGWEEETHDHTKHPTIIKAEKDNGGFEPEPTTQSQTEDPNNYTLQRHYSDLSATQF